MLAQILNTLAGGAFAGSDPQIAAAVHPANQPRNMRSWPGLIFLCSFAVIATTTDWATSDDDSRWLIPSDTGASQTSRVQLPEAESRFERFRIRNAGVQESLVFRSPRAASLLHLDFEASISVVASTAGIQPGLIILLPQQIDPRTGQPLQTIIRGNTLRDIDVLKTLSVKATRQAIEAQFRTVRVELNQADIDTKGAIVIGLALLLDAVPGEQFIEIQDTEYGLVIPPGNAAIAMATAAFGATKSEIVAVRNYLPLDIELDSILLNRQPTILRMAPDHGESIETLRQLGLNTVWAPDFRQTDRARVLHDAGFAVLATPPHPEFEPGDFSRLLQSLPPLEHQCPSISGWYLGTRISRDDLPHLLAWSREVRSGDRTFQRPQFADLTEAEGAAAREIDLIGIGRHVVGRAESFGELRNMLFRRRRSGGQLAFPWTWIQIEPSSTQQAWRSAMRLEQPFVEPEQIQHQVYAAISAGCKGLGFWKTSPLLPDDPRDEETSIAIELACLEIELLEPFLARGRLDGHLSLQLESESRAAAAGFGQKRPSGIQSALGSGKISTSAGTVGSPSGSDAAVITADRAMLILPMVWDNTSQMVPTPMFERSIELTVAATETASAWQVSTTGIHYFPRNETAGGLRVRIDNFDRCAAIVVSSDTELIRRLESRVQRLAERAAAQSTRLANLKYLRVLQVVESLRDEHDVPAETDGLLLSARQAIDRAEHEISGRDFGEAATYSRDCLRILRQIQLACWNDAVSELNDPAESPHAVSFMTLPEHWRLMHYVDRQSGRLSENLLPSGDFENVRLFSEDGWQRDAVHNSVFYSTADLVHESVNNNSVLQLKAWQTRSGPIPEITPLSLSTPPIQVETGDVVLVRGRLRKNRTTPGSSVHSVLVFDSELGPESGLRPKLTQQWQQFELIRPISAASEFRVSFALIGQAEIQLDDLEIRRIPAVESRQILQLSGEESVK
ncbi:MAG TPA: hypothetical protein PLY87_14170 [Planctomycetaceae bacterium]|nr:hypothetical protein [Planctomycetaceae bacterium]